VTISSNLANVHKPQTPNESLVQGVMKKPCSGSKGRMGLCESMDERKEKERQKKGEISLITLQYN
jgi:hypothetical protein